MHNVVLSQLFITIMHLLYMLQQFFNIVLKSKMFTNKVTSSSSSGVKKYWILNEWMNEYYLRVITV